MRNMRGVLEVDPVSRLARIEAGAFGPNLETQLASHGLTLRFFPQLFEFSTLVGWIATRAGGHFATLLTHIDDLLRSRSKTRRPLASISRSMRPARSPTVPKGRRSPA